jgi:hypothetical protein
MAFSAVSRSIGWEAWILPEHPKKFSVAMVKLKSFVVNEQIVEKPFSHRYWRF